MPWPSREQKQSEAYERREACRRDWQRRRAQLGIGDRELQMHLGISERTLYRYEGGEAPAWYDFALVGYWNYRQVLRGERSQKQKGPMG